MNKKLATLHMPYDRTITCFVLNETDTYYTVQVVKVENPCSDKDWKENEEVKISKELIRKIEWKS